MNLFGRKEVLIVKVGSTKAVFVSGMGWVKVVGRVDKGLEKLVASVCGGAKAEIGVVLCDGAVSPSTYMVLY